MQDCNLEVNNPMKDNCVERTLSFSLVKETSIFHGQEWWQGHGPDSTQAPVGPGWSGFPTVPSAGAEGASPPVLQ